VGRRGGGGAECFHVKTFMAAIVRPGSLLAAAVELFLIYRLCL